MEVRDPSAKYLGRPAYKQTEVGVIPELWDAVPLTHVSQYLVGLTYSPDDVRQFGTLVLRSSNVQEGRLAFEDNVYVDMEIPQRAITQEGDILICVRNGSRKLIGKCALIDRATAGSAFGAFMAILRSQSGEYLFQQFQSRVLKKQIGDRMGATINQITNKDMSEFLVPWPLEVTERNSIAAALSDADALIEALEQLLAKKRQIKQGAMQELLTGQRRLPGFAGEWILLPLAAVAPLQRGFDLPNGRLRHGPYPVVYSNGVLAHHNEYQVRGPGVVTGRSGTIGAVTFVEQDYWPHNTSLWVTTFFGHDPKYVFFLYTSIGLERFATGSGVPTLNRNDVHAFKVSIPPTKEEQAAIAAVLSDMDAEIVALEAKLAKARSIKQGMMQELLTGRIRLV